MLTIQILCIGSIKKGFFREGCEEYGKWLSRFCKLQVDEVPAVKIPESTRPGDIAAALEKEGQLLLGKCPKQSHICALCVEGKEPSSQQLADLIQTTQQTRSQMTFIIGSSHGLSGQVKEQASRLLSLSRMTLPHEMARMVLLEQLYRSFCIINHVQYHK